jgi:hypothetical protein
MRLEQLARALAVAALDGVEDCAMRHRPDRLKHIAGIGVDRMGSIADASGGVCATAMTGWGETHGAQYIRFVFANEPVQRLELLGARVREALFV